MAGLLRKSMLYLGLVDDEEGYAEHDQFGDDYGYGEQGYDEPAYDDRPARPEPERRSVRTLDRQDRGAGLAVAEAPAARPQSGGGLSRITTLHPRTYNDARAIGEEYRRGAPVIMNLTEMDEADAKRLVDFAAGLTFGLRGRIEKVTKGVFLLSPHGVDVTLDADTGVVQGGFYNQS
ncbi:MAG TPA: cell division protein SepF [Mycobacteriales bacterium]|nr:cell division protein SepF [Mycobacteriales bacterium]